MARQGGHVQLEQSDMRLALNMANMAKGGFSRTTMEKTQYLIKKPCAKVREVKMWAVELPRHKKMKTAIERDPAMLHQNHMAGCLPCHNGTRKKPQTRLRHIGTGAPPPSQCQ